MQGVATTVVVATAVDAVVVVAMAEEAGVRLSSME